MCACKRQLHIEVFILFKIFFKILTQDCRLNQIIILLSNKEKKKNNHHGTSRNQDIQSIEIQENGKWEKNVALAQVPPGSHCHFVCRLCLHQVTSILQSSCCGMPMLFLHFQRFCPYQGSSASLVEHSG